MNSGDPRPTADLVDDFEDIVASCNIQFRDFGGRKRFAGPIRTIKSFRDNQLFRALLDEPGDGAVVIVDGGGSLDSALMGDLIAAKGVKNGWAGCVIFGAIRDSVAVAELDFGVKALGTNPIKSNKEGTGSIDETVEFGGVRFEPGHWVYCDEDGILVAPEKLV